MSALNCATFEKLAFEYWATTLGYFSHAVGGFSWKKIWQPCRCPPVGRGVGQAARPALHLHNFGGLAVSVLAFSVAPGIALMHRILTTPVPLNDLCLLHDKSKVLDFHELKSLVLVLEPRVLVNIPWNFIKVGLGLLITILYRYRSVSLNL